MPLYDMNRLSNTSSCKHTDFVEVEETTQPDFETICRQYSDRITNLAYRMTGDDEMARDLTQDVFIKVYEHMSSFEGRSGIYTWIYRIAVNHILNYLKKERRYNWIQLMDRSLSEVLVEDVIDPDFQVASRPGRADHNLEQKQREEVVWNMIEKLPAKYRVPLVLFRYEGLSYKEIAETLELSLSAVETRIHRANKRLVDLLEPWIDDL